MLRRPKSIHGFTRKRRQSITDRKKKPGPLKLLTDRITMLSERVDSAQSKNRRPRKHFERRDIKFKADLISTCIFGLTPRVPDCGRQSSQRSLVISTFDSPVELMRRKISIGVPTTLRLPVEDFEDCAISLFDEDVLDLDEQLASSVCDENKQKDNPNQELTNTARGEDDSEGGCTPEEGFDYSDLVLPLHHVEYLTDRLEHMAKHLRASMTKLDHPLQQRLLIEGSRPSHTAADEIFDQLELLFQFVDPLIYACTILHADEEGSKELAERLVTLENETEDKMVAMARNARAHQSAGNSPLDGSSHSTLVSNTIEHETKTNKSTPRHPMELLTENIALEVNRITVGLDFNMSSDDSDDYNYSDKEMLLNQLMAIVQLIPKVTIKVQEDHKRKIQTLLLDKLDVLTKDACDSFDLHVVPWIEGGEFEPWTEMDRLTYIETMIPEELDITDLYASLSFLRDDDDNNNSGQSFEFSLSNDIDDADCCVSLYEETSKTTDDWESATSLQDSAGDLLQGSDYQQPLCKENSPNNAQNNIISKHTLHKNIGKIEEMYGGGPAAAAAAASKSPSPKRNGDNIYWDDLPELVQAAARALGYTSTQWNDDACDSVSSSTMALREEIRLMAKNVRGHETWRPLNPESWESIGFSP